MIRKICIIYLTFLATFFSAHSNTPVIPQNILDSCTQAQQAKLIVSENSINGTPCTTIEDYTLLQSPTFIDGIPNLDISPTGNLVLFSTTFEQTPLSNTTSQQIEFSKAVATNSSSTIPQAPADWTSSVSVGLNHYSGTFSIPINQYKIPNMVNWNRDALNNFRNMAPEQFLQELRNEWEVEGGKFLNFASLEHFAFHFFNMYQFTGFREVVRSFSDYEDFIIRLRNKLFDDHTFRKGLRHIQGFKKRGFVEWIQFSEYERVLQQRQLRAQAEQQRLEQTRQTQERQNKSIAQQQKTLSSWLDKELAQQQQQTLNDQELLDRLENEEILSEHLELEQLATDLENLSQKINDPDTQKLVDLAQCFLEDASDYLEGGNCGEYHKNKDRAQAIALTIANNAELSHANYNLDTHALPHLKNLEINSDSFERYSGTTVQHKLHSELVSTINDTSKFLNACVDNIHMHNIASVIYTSAESARQSKDKYRLDHGFSLSDFCRSLLDVGKNTSFIYSFGPQVGLVIDTLPAIAQGVGKGVMEFGSSCKEFITELATDPKKLIFDYANSIKQASLALSKVTCYAYKNPVNFVDKAVTLASVINQKVKQNPDGAITEIAAFLTKTILGSYTNKAAFSSIGKLTTILKTELALAKQAINESEHIKKLTTPLSSIAKKTSKIIEKAGKQGKQAAQKAIQTLQTNAYLGANKCYSFAAEALAKFPIKMPKVNWRHLFYPIINKKNKLVGLHSSRNNPYNIIEIIKPRDKYGFYEIKYSFKGLTKNSTMFPDRWNRVKILEKIKEAYSNIIPSSIENNGCRGLIKEGIEIQFWFSRHKITKEIMINSIYPCI